MRFMYIIHGAAAPTPALAEALHDMARREVEAGRMIADAGLLPPSAGATLKLRKGQVLDGPFAETKEVIGGFAIFELPDLPAAIASARAFLDVHRTHMPELDITCEIRVVAGSQVEILRAAAKG